MPVPHDELFRRILGDAEAARGLLRVPLPPTATRRLDLGALRVTPGSYTDRRLRLSQSDLLLETTSRGREPTLVRRPKGLGLRELTPSFTPIILDLAARDDREFGENVLVNAVRRVLKHAKAGPSAELRRAFADVLGLEPSRLQPGLLEALVRYLFRARQGRSVRSILQALPEGEMRRGAMTVAESLERKGERKGEKKGRAAGHAEGERRGVELGRIRDKQEVLARLVERKFGLTERERKSIRSHANSDELDGAIDAIVSARSKAAVLRHLR